jgi:replicative DNA helicase
MIAEFQADMERLHNGKSLTSGLAPIDKHFYHFTEGNYILIAARTSVGKTALSLSMVFNMIQCNKKVLFISLEMSVSEIIMRLASMHSSIPIWKFKYDKDTYTSPLLHDFISLIERNNLIVLNDLSEENLRIKIKLMTEKFNLDAVFIDHIGLVSSKDQKHGANQVLTRISRNIKLSAIENAIPIFVLSQLNRESVKRKDDKPILPDIRDSGSLEQDADIVMFIYRYSETNPDGNKILGEKTEVIVAKNRNGSCGTINNIQFKQDIARFIESYDNTSTTNEVLPENWKKHKQQQTHFQETEKEIDGVQLDADGSVVF